MLHPSSCMRTRNADAAGTLAVRHSSESSKVMSPGSASACASACSVLRARSGSETDPALHVERDRVSVSTLDLAKVESGTVKPKMTELSLDDLRRAVGREFEHVAVVKDIGFSVEVAAGLPETVVTDAQRLRQILTNLLANAFKFTERGEVRLELKLADGGWTATSGSLDDAPAVLALAVSDTGIGIAADEHHRIFEAFSQADGTSARAYGGTGLGLSISRELVTLLGGEITVISAPGEGSIFTVFLPLGAAAPPAVRPSDNEVVTQNPPPARSDAGDVAPRAPAATPQPGAGQGPVPTPGESDFHGTMVLVVDDDFRNIFAMTALLERGNAVVTVAESGAAALALLAPGSGIDIVLMDIMMPVMDGYATIRAIRDLDHLKALPIIAVTGKAIPGERQRCIDAGANDFVPKPVNTTELLAALRPWLPATARPAG